jgi:hypothetical protein
METVASAAPGAQSRPAESSADQNVLSFQPERKVRESAGMVEGFAKKDNAEKDAKAAQTVAGHKFDNRDGVWCQEGYRDQEVTVLVRGSEELEKLTKRHTRLAKILGLGDRVIFRFENTWYKVEPPTPDK